MVFRDELVYLKELHLLAEFEVNLLFTDLNADSSRFILENRIFRTGDGKEVAYIWSEGAFLTHWAELSRLSIFPNQGISKSARLVKVPY